MHLTCSRQIPRQVDGVELAARGAKSAANALVKIHHGGSALEAAAAFDLHLLLGERLAKVREGLYGRLLAFGVIVGLQLNVVPVELYELAQIPAYGHGLAGVHEAVHGDHGIAARSIVFPEKHGISIDGQATGDEIPLPSSIRKAELRPCRSFTVPYSFVDLNGHMNNTRYLDLAEDCIHEEVQGRELTALRMEFVREVRLGDTIELSCGRDGERWLVCGGREKTNFRIELSYK